MKKRFTVITFASEPYSDFVELLFYSIKKKRDDVRFVVAHDNIFDLKREYLNGVYCLQQAPDFNVWPQWLHVMSKMDVYSRVMSALEFDDNDYIIDIDADTCFYDTSFFDKLEGDFAGMPNDYYKSSHRINREWTWVSGVCVAYKAWLLRKITEIDPKTIEELRHELQHKMDCSHVWDVCFSYMANMFTNNIQHMRLLVMDVENMFKENYVSACEGEYVAHFNAPFEMFLGEKVSGKLDIPRVIKELKTKGEIKF